MTVYTITELQELLKLNPKQAKALMRTDGFPSNQNRQRIPSRRRYATPVVC